MRYIVEDTPEGYSLELRSPRGRLLATHDEKGGHGEIEKLYVHALAVQEELAAEARQEFVRARRR